MKLVIALLLLLSYYFAPAQNVLEDMAQYACTCLGEKDLDTMASQKLKMEAGFCILNYYQAHTAAVNEYFGISEFNGETGRMIGEKLGVKMAAVCPELVMKLAGTVEEEQGGRSEDEAGYIIEGKIARIEEGDFITYHLKADDGKTYKVLWFRNFEGSDELVDDPKRIVGKRASITVHDVECYIPKAKGYYSIKEIIAINLL